MRKKLNRLSICSFVIAIVIFVLSFAMYHYLTPNGFTTVWHAEPEKPFITLLFAIWGVMFLFSSVISLLIGWIFFKENNR